METPKRDVAPGNDSSHIVCRNAVRMPASIDFIRHAHCIKLYYVVYIDNACDGTHNQWVHVDFMFHQYKRNDRSYIHKEPLSSRSWVFGSQYV